MDAEREVGERSLDQALAQLQAQAAQLSENLRQFESVCLGRHGDSTSCERLTVEMAVAGEALTRSLEGAEDDARHSWVPPGVVRALRLKHGFDESTGRDLTDKVRRLANQYHGS